MISMIILDCILCISYLILGIALYEMIFEMFEYDYYVHNLKRSYIISIKLISVIFWPVCFVGFLAFFVGWGIYCMVKEFISDLFK